MSLYFTNCQVKFGPTGPGMIFETIQPKSSWPYTQQPHYFPHIILNYLLRILPLTGLETSRPLLFPSRLISSFATGAQQIRIETMKGYFDLHRSLCCQDIHSFASSLNISSYKHLCQAGV